MSDYFNVKITRKEFLTLPMETRRRILAEQVDKNMEVQGDAGYKVSDFIKHDEITNNQGWCPQHGYPLPCAKCGMLPSQFEQEIRVDQKQKDFDEWSTSTMETEKLIRNETRKEAQGELSGWIRCPHCGSGNIVWGEGDIILKCECGNVLKTI